MLAIVLIIIIIIIITIIIDLRCLVIFILSTKKIYILNYELTREFEPQVSILTFISSEKCSMCFADTA